ncbi:hypothetical protein [Streptomyces sp. NPDC085932]|uniref:hypothetical protein n=1 Tax=Streptomyces sp. NPDC085932 TaxID=3365741 RepID=UPI0037D16D80
MTFHRTGAHGAASVAIGGDAHGPVMTSPVFGSSAVPMAVALKDTQKVFSDVGVAEFTGRAWLVAYVDAFLRERTCGFLWVEAEAGLGKTALAAWLVRERAYVSHFARHTQGGSVRVGLRNVAAQLISRYGLSAEFAPGGMLPDWVSEPDGFDALLSRSAEQARAEDGRLVLVMDGADEAEAPDDGMPWGLPSLLPEGVFVVGTYRTGRRPSYSESPSHVVRIDRADARNQTDVRQYLDRALRTEPVAERLAAAGTSADEVVPLLMERSGGVWVYLRYVLAGLRTGQQPVGELGSLPADLSGYYARQLTGWQGTPGWAGTGRDVLATLVAAREPLSYNSLSRLSGAGDDEAVRRWCDVVIRPFLTADDGPGERRYELYHATARSFFGGSPEEVQDDRLKVLAAELGEGAARAHRRIAQRYVTEFGGLGGDGGDNGGISKGSDSNGPPLALLAADPALASVDGGYALRHLGHHLVEAGWSTRLSRLLAAESPHGDRQAQNVWFTTHEYAGSLDTFLDDVERARQAAARRTDEALERRTAAPSLVEELRCRLMTASVAGHTDSVGPELLGQLVGRGVWTATRGLAHARRLSDPGDRFRALLTLQPHLADDRRPAVCEEALEAVRVCDYVSLSSLEGDHYFSPAQVIPHLPEGRRAAVADEAVAAALACTAGDLRGQLLAVTAVHAPPGTAREIARRALEELLSEPDDWCTGDSVSALVSILPLLPEGAGSGALARAKDALLCGDLSPNRTSDWAALLPLLTPAERTATLAAAVADTDSLEYAEAGARDCARLLPVLPAEQGEAFLERTLAAARSAAEPAERAGALSRLLPLLAPKNRTAAVRDILATGPRLNQHVLARLAPHVTAAQLEDALRKALFTPSTSRVIHLAALTDRLPAHDRAVWAAETVRVAELVGTPTARATARTALLPTLPAAQRAAGARQALDLMRTVTSDPRTLRRRLVPWLSADDRRAAAVEWFSDPEQLLLADQSVLAQVVAHLPHKLLVDAVRHWLEDDEWVGLDDLRVLGPLLPDHVHEEVLAALAGADESTKVPTLFISLIPHLPDRLVGDALAAGRALDDAALRAPALSALVPRLPDGQRAVVAQEAFEAALACAWQPWLPDALPGLRAGFPAGLAERVQEALTAIRAVGDAWERAEACCVLLSVLPAQERAPVVAEALDCVSQVEGDMRAQRLGTLVPYLDHESLGRAVGLAPDDAGLATALLTRFMDEYGCSPREFVALVRRLVSRTSQDRALTVLTDNLSRLVSVAGDEARAELTRAVDDVLTWWP